MDRLRGVSSGWQPPSRAAQGFALRHGAGCRSTQWHHREAVAVADFHHIIVGVVEEYLGHNNPVFYDAVAYVGNVVLEQFALRGVQACTLERQVVVAWVELAGSVDWLASDEVDAHVVAKKPA